MMKLRHVAVPALLLAVGLYAGLAPAAEDPDGKREVASRYRISVVRVTPLPDSDGVFPSGIKLKGEFEVRLGPVAEGPASFGAFGAVAWPNDLMSALGRMGKVEVIFGGETETTLNRTAQITYGQRFPVTSLDIRGEQSYLTTKFEKTGLKFQITRMGVNEHQFDLEFSAITAVSMGGGPILFESSTKGTMRLPDASTSVHSFFTRTEGAALAHGQEWSTSHRDTGDEETLFFVFVTRVDME